MPRLLPQHRVDEVPRFRVRRLERQAELAPDLPHHRNNRVEKPPPHRGVVQPVAVHLRDVLTIEIFGAGFEAVVPHDLADDHRVLQSAERDAARVLRPRLAEFVVEAVREFLAGIACNRFGRASIEEDVGAVAHRHGAHRLVRHGIADVLRRVGKVQRFQIVRHEFRMFRHSGVVVGARQAGAGRAACGLSCWRRLLRLSAHELLPYFFVVGAHLLELFVFGKRLRDFLFQFREFFFLRYELVGYIILCVVERLEPVIEALNEADIAQCVVVFVVRNRVVVVALFIHRFRDDICPTPAFAMKYSRAKIESAIASDCRHDTRLF